MKVHRFRWFSVSCALLLGTWSSSARAASSVPNAIRLVGQATSIGDGSVQNLSGPVDLVLCLLKTATDTTPVWCETQSAIASQSGGIDLAVGTGTTTVGTSLQDAIANGAHCLTMTLNGDPLGPPYCFYSVAYSLSSAHAEVCDSLPGVPASNVALNSAPNSFQGTQHFQSGFDVSGPDAGTVINVTQSSVTVNPSIVVQGTVEHALVCDSVTGSFSGDMSGTENAMVVTGLQSHHVSDTPPTDQQVLIYSSVRNQWEPGNPLVSTTTGGDLAGALSAATVIRIQGHPVASTMPSDKQVLIWNAAMGEWEPGMVDFSTSVTFSNDGGPPFTVTNNNITNNLVTNLNAQYLDGKSDTYFTNASNISSGTLNDARLSGNVPLLNTPNDFSAPQSIQTTSGPELIVSAGAGQTADLIQFRASDGTTVLSFVDTSGVFNGSCTELNGQPGSYYTNASNLAAGTVSDTLLSANICRLNSANTFQTNTGTEVRIRAGSSQSSTHLLEFQAADAGLLSYVDVNGVFNGTCSSCSDATTVGGISTSSFARVDATSVFQPNVTTTFQNQPSFTKDGGAPFLVSSTTKVTNLHADNADSLNGVAAGSYARLDNTQTFTSASANTFLSGSSTTVNSGATTTFNNQPSFTQSTGTAPFVVNSTTRVDNLHAQTADTAGSATTATTATTAITALNANQLGGVDAGVFARLDTTQTFTSASANTFVSGSSTTFNSGATTIFANQPSFTQPDGGPPFFVTSATKVTNLHAETADNATNASNATGLAAGAYANAISFTHLQDVTLDATKTLTLTSANVVGGTFDGGTFTNVVSLAAVGNISTVSGNISTTSGIFSGNGSGLTNVRGTAPQISQQPIAGCTFDATGAPTRITCLDSGGNTQICSDGSTAPRLCSSVNATPCCQACCVQSSAAAFFDDLAHGTVPAGNGNMGADANLFLACQGSTSNSGTPVNLILEYCTNRCQGVNAVRFTLDSQQIIIPQAVLPWTLINNRLGAPFNDISFPAANDLLFRAVAQYNDTGMGVCFFIKNRAGVTVPNWHTDPWFHAQVQQTTQMPPW
jgi:hypothetical protein